MTKLHIADGLSLPLDFVTQTQAILAMRRRGKTYTASVQAEELLKAGQQIVVIDITGAWWGLKSSADGKSEAFNIVVAGGEHADIPLRPDAGQLLAQAIVADRFSCILDLKLLRKSERLTFLASFLETFHSLNREPVHVFADEADDYIPQTITWKEVNASKCLGAMDDMVRRGGINGIGCTLITQRPAVINNNVLTQCQMLTLLRITHPADIKPIREWVKVHATPDEEAKVLKDLPLLGLGSAVVWSPGWPEDHPIGIKHVQIRERETFNSSRTPKHGERVAAPKKLARPDLDKLGERIRELAEKAKADDPRELRKTIAELQKKLRDRPAETKVETKTEYVEVPVLKNGQLDRTLKIAEKVEAIAAKAGEQQQALLGELGELRRLITPAAAPRPVQEKKAVPSPAVHRASPRPVPAKASAVHHSESPGDGGLDAAQQRILDTIATLNLRGIDVNRESVARWMAIHPNGGRYGSNLARLREMGYLDGFELTEAGRAVATAGDTGPDAVLAALPDEGHRRVFQAIMDAGETLTRETLAERLGIHPNGGRYGSTLGWLRTMGVIPERGDIKLTPGALA